MRDSGFWNIRFSSSSSALTAGRIEGEALRGGVIGCWVSGAAAEPDGGMAEVTLAEEDVSLSPGVAVVLGVAVVPGVAAVPVVPVASTWGVAPLALSSAPFPSFTPGRDGVWDAAGGVGGAGASVEAVGTAVAAAVTTGGDVRTADTPAG